jgi:hypothetical protein
MDQKNPRTAILRFLFPWPVWALLVLPAYRIQSQVQILLDPTISRIMFLFLPSFSSAIPAVRMQLSSLTITSRMQQSPQLSS